MEIYISRHAIKILKIADAKNRQISEGIAENYLLMPSIVAQRRSLPASRHPALIQLSGLTVRKSGGGI